MSECTTNTLSEIVDKYLIYAGVDHKKHYARYLILGQECWEEIFQNTLWVIKSVWMPTKAGSLYNYVDLPTDCLRLLGVGVDDRCGLIQPLFYNNQLNVVAKPTSKKCGCSCSDCGGLCEGVNSTTKTTKLMFSIAGVPYYQTCWIKYCPNGDVLEFCSTPAKKYNNIVGDGGDYDEDEYNPDWLIGNPPFSDYSIEYIETQTKVCHLETKVCGCPQETPENNQLFLDCCGFYIDWGCKKKPCKQYSPNINNNKYGEIKMSECGNKIEYHPNRHWQQVTTKQIPDYLLVNYQTTGENVGSETIIPKFAREVMYAAMDCKRKEYNSSFSEFDKQSSYYRYQAKKNDVIGYLNPINLIELSKVQNIPIKY